MIAVVEQLNARGMRATHEYPGYVRVESHPDDGDRSITWDCGTANGTWGGNDEAGIGAFTSAIPADSDDVTLIASYITACIRGRGRNA